MDAGDLDNRFEYHAPTGNKASRHEYVRVRMRKLADIVDDIAPDCREKSLAITALEEAMMWANAAIARNPEP